MPERSGARILAHELPESVGERNVQAGTTPHGRETSYAPRTLGRCRLHVRRGADAHQPRGCANEDGKEVVDARAAAPEAIEALQMEPMAPAPR